MKEGYFDFGEPITKMEVSETLSKKGCKLEHIIVNDKWKLSPTNNPEIPFRKRRMKESI